MQGAKRKMTITFFDEVNRCVNRLANEKKTLDKIIRVLRISVFDKKQVFICGNGGSANTASHMAADLFKICEIDAICLNDNIALTTALINDDGWENVYVKQLERKFHAGDILIVFSVHGGSGSDVAGLWSQNLNKAVEYVKTHKGFTIGFSGFDGGWMKDNCNICLVVPADSTPIVESMHVLIHHYVAFELNVGDRK